jgi:DNA repair exonuclease SbcCD nuclease subunit
LQSFRFIHTGDIHLDSPLKGLAGQQGAAAERIRTATRTAFENLISQAIEDQVDFVVIAGDLYDGDWRDYQTGLFFVKQMGRLAQAKIPVFLLHGNHDAESQITRKLTLPTASQRRTARPEFPAARHHGQSGPGLSVTTCFARDKRRKLPVVFLARGVIRLRHLIRGARWSNAAKLRCGG